MFLLPLILVAFMWNGVHEHEYRGPAFKPGTHIPADLYVQAK